MKISLVASSIRPNLWGAFCGSLIGNSVPYETIFVGDFSVMGTPQNVIPIVTKVKPCQCYEIGFRRATGDLVHWTADDAEYEPHALDKVAELWKKLNNPKAIIALRTIEDKRDCTEWHHLIGGRKDTPVMAPFGFMDRGFLNELGGYDRRYHTGQSENCLVMRALAAGGIVIQTQIKVYVEHQAKHGGSRGSLFRGKWYQHDRQILENSWLIGRNVSSVQLDAFEPFFDENLLTVSQGSREEGFPWA